MTEKYISVLYHGNCPDGYAAAFACWQRFGETADYLPVTYGQPVPDIPRDHRLYIVDFSYSEETLKRLLFERIALGKAAEPYIVVLDHHASAARDLQSLQRQQLRGLVILFDLEECGASLTWKYFLTRGCLPEPSHQPDVWAAVDSAMPPFFHYVRDRDLWRWQLPASKAISLAYWALDKSSWESIELFAQDLDEAKGQYRILQEGQAMEAYANALVREQAARVTHGVIGGHQVPIVNATTLFSEVGDYLCTHGTALCPMPLFVAYYFDRNDQKRQWGLRSRGACDCSVIAQQYGGGGHPGAAGFVTEQTWLGEPTTEETE